jgi:hypothetical protein
MRTVVVWYFLMVIWRFPTIWVCLKEHRHYELPGYGTWRHLRNGRSDYDDDTPEIRVCTITYDGEDLAPNISDFKRGKIETIGQHLPPSAPQVKTTERGNS